MSTAGEAAALFGSPDSAADPFAVVLGGDEVPTPARPNGDAKSTSTASDFFANATDSSDLFAAEETALTHGTLDYDRQNTWCDASTQQNYTYDTAAAPTYAPTSSEYASQNHMNGWYDQYGQGMTHEISQSSEYTHYDSQPQATLHQSYGSYAPAVPDYNAAPPVSERTQNPTYTAYDPYKPAMQTTPNYTPAYNAHPPAQSSYDPYKPTAHTAPPPPDPVHAQTHHSYAGEPSSTWTRSSPAMIAPLLPRPPSPPGPSVASFRPKTMNAYDPPLPPMPAPRHISGSPWHTHHAAPLVSPLSQQYGAQIPQSPARGPSRGVSAHHAPTAPPQQSTHVSEPYTREQQWSSHNGPPQAVNHDEWASQEYSTGGRDHTIDDGYERSYDANRQYQAIPGERRDVSNSMYHASPVANYSDASTHVTDTMSPVMHAQQPARDMEDPMLGMAFVHPDEEDGVITSAPVTGSTSSPRLSAQTWGHVESLAVVPSISPAMSARSLPKSPVVQATHLPRPPVVQASTFPGLPAAQASNFPKLPPASPYTPASTLSPPKETIPLATATSPYEPYKPNRASPHEPPHPTHNYALPDPNQATSVPPSFDAPVTSTQGSFNGSAHGSVSHSPERTKSPGSSSVRSVASIPRQSYDPPAKSFATTHSERTKSPGDSSIRSIPSVQRQTYDPPARKYSTSATMSPSAIVRPMSTDSHQSGFSNLYEPQTISDAKRTSSPAQSIRSVNGPVTTTYDPYTPAEKHVATSSPHTRSTSTGSTSSASVVRDDRYAPPRQVTQLVSERSRGTFSTPSQPLDVYAASSLPLASQVVTLAPPTHPTYAPSPSLLGTNDPLGRTSVRVPVISFGSGGKLVTCFHGASMNTGFDVALSSRQSTDIKMYVLHQIIPESALETSAASYPGPLFSDPGTPTTSLVRSGTATQLKTKKARVVKYLEERSDEMSQGIGYHHPGSLERKRADAKRILVMLLKVMVENDGRLSGSPQIDAAVRGALIPRLDGTSSPPDALKNVSAMNIPRAADIHASSSELSSAFSSLGSLQDSHDFPVAVHTLRSSHLDKIQELLLRGDRRGACHYAADEKLWAHAMIIASSIDKECWKDVATEFIRTELTSKNGKPNASSLLRAGDEKCVASNGREALRVAYSLYAGNGATSVQELVPPNALLHNSQSLQVSSAQLSITPMSPNFPPIMQTMNIPNEVLANWAETAAMILSNPMTAEASAALTALGDQLTAHQWTEAAHVCYLLSPQTSPFGGMGSASRLVLLGGPGPTNSPIFHKDPDPIIFSEIAEFALSLATPAKGQETFTGLPHLQPYRLIRAASLAEIGHVQLANRYCEAIGSCINRSSPYTNMTFIEQLKELTDRLIAAPQVDKSGSWIGSKMAKPSLDSIGNWLEGRFTKFIAGEGDTSSRHEDATAIHPHGFTGPFAHYSTISSTTTSAQPSPHHSQTDLTETPSSPPPPRAGSAMALRSSAASHVQINRASSAMEVVRPFHRKPSPVPRVSSASAASFADTPSFGQALNPYGNGHAFGRGMDETQTNNNSHGDVSPGRHVNGPSTGSWWGPPDSDAPTPTASSFMSFNANAASTSGFISPMDDPAFSVTPTAGKPFSNPIQSGPAQLLAEEDDDDDLGLGNSSLRPKQTENTAAAASQPEETKAAQSADKPELKPTASGGWLNISRLWKRNETTPSAVKANLGEQSSFYYDKELKRWVNKNGAAEAAKPAQPPPPPRAQTASPGRSHAPLPAGTAVSPPLARPATAHAIDLTTEPPPRPPMRVRSNLVPTEAGSFSAPPTPASATIPDSATGPPPSTGRASRQGKRAVRSRYVDIFQQEATGTPS